MHDFIVRVFAKSAVGQKDRYLGTAFLIDDCYLLTNRHVIKDFAAKDLYLSDGPWVDHNHVQAIINHDDIDVALLRLKLPNSQATAYLPLRPVKDLKGKEVTIPGFKSESESSTLDHTVSGELSQYSTWALQGKDHHGKSGSPVIYNNGIVGIFYARSDPDNPKQDNHESYIYPYAAFKAFVETYVPPKPQAKIDYAALHPEQRIARVDREAQWDWHIEAHLTSNPAKKNFAFVVAGIKQEWPESLKYRLLMHLELERDTPIRLSHQRGSVQQWQEHLWVRLMDHFSISPLEAQSRPSTKQQLIDLLTDSLNPMLFYWHLDPKSSADLDFIKTVIESWEGLQLTQAKRPHCLLIIYGIKEKGWGIAAYYREWQVEQWRKKLAKKLAATANSHVVVPKLAAITKEHVTHWSRTMGFEEAELTKIDEAMDNIKAEKIPHLTLRNLYFKEILKSKQAK